MNEQLQETINVILSKALSIAETTGDFLAEQVPEVVTQLLVWHAVESAITFFLGLALVLVWLLYLVPFIIRAIKGNDEDAQVVAIFVGILGGIPSLIVIPIFLSDIVWLKIWVAPKLYLLEYAASLVK